jgi:hypothetical protein
LLFLAVSFCAHSQAESNNLIQTEWKTISLGKLQKKPRFKEPMISVKYISEDEKSFFNLSLKYMFTDAVFEEAVPVEYFKNEKIEFSTNKGKFELRALKYSKARRMNSVAQKTADIRVIFAGDLSFLKENLVKSFTVHYAQGYQNINLSFEESNLLRDSYNRFLSILPKPKQPTLQKEVEITGQARAKAAQDTVGSSQNSLDKIRRQARNFRK